MINISEWGNGTKAIRFIEYMGVVVSLSDSVNKHCLSMNKMLICEVFVFLFFFSFFDSN